MQQGFTSFQAQKAMKELRAALVNRRKRIVDAASLMDLKFGPVEEHRFDVTAVWEDGEHIVSFTSGNSFTKYGRHKHSYRMTYCAFADRIIDEVLRARGVKK